MSIKPRCAVKLSPQCEGELEQMGAILLSPPKGDDVKKYHVCIPCYDKIRRLMF